MQPEAVAAGLVARGGRGVLWEAEPLLGGFDDRTKARSNSGWRASEHR